MVWFRIRLLAFHRVMLGAGGSCFAVLVLPDIIEVPLREVQMTAALLAVPAFSMLIPASVTSALDEVERVAARPAHRGRLETAAALVAVSAIPVAACIGSSVSPVTGARNVAICAALSLASTAFVPESSAWLPSGLLLASSFMFGLDDDRAPRAWAVLLHGPTTANVLLATFATFAATCLFVTRGPRRPT
jgi:hypothetical protein